MKVAIIGSGGREHALAWKIAQSELVSRVICLPGNPGTASEPKCENHNCDLKDTEALSAVIEELAPNLTVVGPEQPLVDGLADRLRRKGIAVVGPGAGAAQLEGSKAFAKEMMVAAGVPTARYFRVDNLDDALARIDEFDVPPVVKADGLAAGKGVTVCTTHQEAKDTVQQFMVERQFGSAGQTVVLEERLEGVEASYIVLTDGNSFVPLTSSQHHTRLGDGDTGPNTGGMGAFSPTPHLTDSLETAVQKMVIQPMLDVMRERGLEYRGFLYAGIMLTADGPKVLEFNVRSGDPETQAVLFGLDSDLVPTLCAVAAGTLSEQHSLRFTPSATIVMASEGYPTSARTGVPITGISQVEGAAKVFQAGTKTAGDTLLSSGGRVLAVTSRGKTLQDAINTGYQALELVQFEGAQFRRDIGGSVC